MNMGYVIPQNWGPADPADVIELAVRAEALANDSVWVNHHILNVGYVRERLGDRPYYDALTTLTWVAERTSRVRLGTTVPLLPYLNPLVLAKTVATLDLFSGGRVTLGVGVGTLEEENRALGSDYATRGAYANEAIQVLRELWTADDPAFAGRFFNFAGVRFSPSPLQPGGVPILVGGGSRAALGRCARLGGLGDGWHPIGGSVATVAGRDCGAPRAVGRARPRRDVVEQPTNHAIGRDRPGMRASPLPISGAGTSSRRIQWSRYGARGPALDLDGGGGEHEVTQEEHSQDHGPRTDEAEPAGRAERGFAGTRDQRRGYNQDARCKEPRVTDTVHKAVPEPVRAQRREDDVDRLATPRGVGRAGGYARRPHTVRFEPYVVGAAAGRRQDRERVIAQPAEGRWRVVEVGGALVPVSVLFTRAAHGRWLPSVDGELLVGYRIDAALLREGEPQARERDIGRGECGHGPGQGAFLLRHQPRNW